MASIKLTAVCKGLTAELCAYLCGYSRAKLMGYNRIQLTKAALICKEWPMTSLPSNLKVEMNFYFKGYRVPTLSYASCSFFFVSFLL